ncbi:MAG: hypothetical protein ACE5FM_00070 [Methyloligellaceae bacterium]
MLAPLLRDYGQFERIEMIEDLTAIPRPGCTRFRSVDKYYTGALTQDAWRQPIMDHLYTNAVLKDEDEGCVYLDLPYPDWFADMPDDPQNIRHMRGELAYRTEVCNGQSIRKGVFICKNRRQDLCLYSVAVEEVGRYINTVMRMRFVGLIECGDTPAQSAYQFPDGTWLDELVFEVPWTFSEDPKYPGAHYVFEGTVATNWPVRIDFWCTSLNMTLWLRWQPWGWRFFWNDHELANYQLVPGPGTTCPMVVQNSIVRNRAGKLGQNDCNDSHRLAYGGLCFVDVFPSDTMLDTHASKGCRQIMPGLEPPPEYQPKGVRVYAETLNDCDAESIPGTTRTCGSLWDDITGLEQWSVNLIGRRVIEGDGIDIYFAPGTFYGTREIVFAKTDNPGVLARALVSFGSGWFDDPAYNRYYGIDTLFAIHVPIPGDDVIVPYLTADDIGGANVCNDTWENADDKSWDIGHTVGFAACPGYNPAAPEWWGCNRSTTRLRFKPIASYPQIAVQSASNFAFGDVEIGTTAGASIQITNPGWGENPWYSQDVAIQPTLRAKLTGVIPPFRLTRPTSAEVQVTNVPIQVIVYFAPTEARDYSATLTIQSRDIYAEGTGPVETVQLTGRGIPPP